MLLQNARRQERHFDSLVYAQHGHDLMGCKSPVGKSLFNNIEAIKH